MTGTDPDPDRVARACIDEYTRHPKFTPAVRSNGLRQFTVLAGVVLYDRASERLECVSLGTGAKCLPSAKLPKSGEALHDSHAEVLARRAAVRASRCGCTCLLYRLGGDASTSALAINQPAEMAALKAISPMPRPEKGTTARGRDNYNALGWLRTKPARADAPPTISHSCSDKIALWSLVGFQGALLYQLMGPLFFSGLVIGDVLGQFSDTDVDRVRGDCRRALVERLRPLPDGVQVPYELQIAFTSVPFPHARSQIPESNVVSDPESHIWIGPSGSSQSISETTVNGFRRGVGPKRYQTPRFQPALCKASLMRLHLNSCGLIGETELPSGTYYQLKRHNHAEKYEATKSVLRSPGAPLEGWIVSGQEWENFETTMN
ncbi:tRNA-specific adenosine deaminase 1 [Rhizoctonia solani]|uniref:tRNA-specific adenosine deaminase 1 n=1 Tax=Rhizoctonia solani TaxID=456999 RepID=A0A0K6GEM5_9AGAM|nr:tRNA-specific adenosine deaminase 1 [Rhizoctonia solani]